MTNKEKILEMYHNGISALDMAKELMCTRQNIYYTLKSCGLSTKSNVSKLKNAKKIRTVWQGIAKRCSNKNSKDYKNYGGRGICMSSEWLEFEKFYNWAINNHYELGTQLDRIDNNGDYTPSNCRWVSCQENNQNKRTNVLSKTMVVAARIAKTAKIMNVTEISKFFGVERTVVGSAISKKTWKNVYP